MYVLHVFQNWIATFEKPKTEPNSLQPSTTVLSPYIKFGCLSSRRFYWKLQEIYSKSKVIAETVQCVRNKVCSYYAFTFCSHFRNTHSLQCLFTASSCFENIFTRPALQHQTSIKCRETLFVVRFRGRRMKSICKLGRWFAISYILQIQDSSSKK